MTRKASWKRPTVPGRRYGAKFSRWWKACRTVALATSALALAGTVGWAQTPPPPSPTAPKAPPLWKPGNPPPPAPPLGEPPPINSAPWVPPAIVEPKPGGDPVLPPPRMVEPNRALDSRRSLEPDLRMEPGRQIPQPYGSVRPPHRTNAEDRILGMTPVANAKTAEKYDKYYRELIDPEANLDLIVGRNRLLILKETPKRILLGSEQICEYNLIGKDQITLMGRFVGETTLTFWFTDPKDATKEDILVYHVRVLPDPERVRRIERAYKALENQINCAFPNSVVCLHLVGDKLVITGQAMDIAESAQILKIVRANAQQLGGFSQASRLPVDRTKSIRNPADPTEQPGQSITPGVDEYVLDGTSNIVNMLRIPGEQTVNLKVTIAEVNRDAARSIGVNFTLLNNAGMPYFANATGALGIGAQGGVAGGAGLAGGACIPDCPGIPVGNSNLLASIDNGQVRLAINALRQVKYARTLAEPNLTTINGQTAQLHAGGEVPLPILAAGGGGGGGSQGALLQGVSFRQYGVNVNFTPYITDRDRIRLVLDATVTGINQQGQQTNIGGSVIPYFDARHVNTTVEMREGQTLAVAGLIQNSARGDTQRVPFLGDLPFLSNIWGVNRVSAAEQELIMIVTPELVHPLDNKDRLAVPGADLFEPTDIEFYLFGRLESHRQVDFRSPIMSDWQRVRNYRSLEQSFINGPTGYCQ